MSIQKNTGEQTPGQQHNEGQEVFCASVKLKSTVGKRVVHTSDFIQQKASCVESDIY